MRFSTDACMIRSAAVHNGLIMQAFEGKQGIGGQRIGKSIQMLISHDEVKIAQCRSKDLKRTLLQGIIACGQNSNTLRPSLLPNEATETFSVKIDENGSQ